MLWTHTSAIVTPFIGNTVVDLPVPCSFDFNIAATKYFAGLENGEVPLCLQFSGTVFYANASGMLQVGQISWEKEARYRLPVQLWREMMDIYYPNTAWLCLQRDAFERLHDYKMRSGIPTWEQVLERIILRSKRRKRKCVRRRVGELMHTTSIEELANAVLYEGYLLYPYRASAVKNQRRFNFGVLTPQSYSEAQRGTEPWSMQTECLLLADSKTILDVKVRFLHLRRRDRGFYPPLAEWDQGAAWEASNVQKLEVDGQTYHSCEEAVEREVVERRAVIESTGYSSRQTFSFPLTREYDPISDSKGQIAGVIVRSQRPIEGAIELTITECEVDR
jgi:hypothetical protein